MVAPTGASDGSWNKVNSGVAVTVPDPKNVVQTRRLPELILNDLADSSALS
jgi:hypothetical protein